jgi:hypothetical protein
MGEDEVSKPDPHNNQPLPTPMRGNQARPRNQEGVTADSHQSGSTDTAQPSGASQHAVGDLSIRPGPESDAPARQRDGEQMQELERVEEFDSLDDLDAFDQTNNDANDDAVGHGGSGQGPHARTDSVPAAPPADGLPAEGEASWNDLGRDQTRWRSPHGL